MRTSLPVSVSVLQRNGTNKVSIDAEIDRDKDIRDHALQELVHTIWKLRSSPALKSASWRPERTDGVHSSPKAEDQCLS